MITRRPALPFLGSGARKPADAHASICVMSSRESCAFDWSSERLVGCVDLLPSACDLTQRPGRNNIDSVVIVGTLTSVCCESSARDAAMQDFNVVHRIRREGL